MAAKRMELIGLTALVLAATAAAALAQTFNTSGPVTVPTGPEAAVSPALPSGLLNSETSGSNPLTGLPCSGSGASAVSGVGGLADTTTPPPDADASTYEIPTIESVFGSGGTLGAC